MSKQRLVIILISALVLCLSFFGLNVLENNVEAAVLKDEQINLYISGPQKMVTLLENEFEKEHGDVLNVYHTGCGPLRQKVWTEMVAGSIQADLVWGAEPIMYQALRDKGVLQQYKSAQIKNIKEEYIYGDGYYTAVNARYGVIIYNKNKVKGDKIPAGWSDLMDQKWKNKQVMADASQSAMALALTAGLYQIRDNSWDLIEALDKNNIRLTKQNIEAVARIENGEAEVGIAPHDAVFRLHKQAKKQGVKSPLAICWPDEGAVSVQRPIAIIKKERNSVQARIVREFVDYALSKKAQLIANKFGFITVRKDLSLPAAVPKEIKSIGLDWEYASAHEGDIRDGFKGIMFTN